MLFNSAYLEVGFVEDFPALWVTMFSLVFLSYNFTIIKKLFYEITSKNHSISYKTPSTIRRLIYVLTGFACLYFSYWTNNQWVTSQLNNNKITWFSYNGGINLALLPTSLELFNPAGFIYWIACMAHWFLFFIILSMFLTSIIILSLYIKKTHDVTNQFKKTIDTFIIHSTYFFFYILFYYVSLQINDLIKEGYQTFILHPNRLIVFIVVVVSAIAYIILRTYAFYSKTSINKTSSIITSRLKTEIQFDILIIITPILIIALYYFFMNYVFKVETYEFKLSVTFFLFFFLVIISIINHYAKERRFMEVESLDHENKLLRNYSESVDNIYQELRTYKHDITNILLGLKTFIEEENYYELNVYFHEHILHSSPIKNINYEVLTSLLTITHLPLKGLILSKHTTAMHLNIDFELEIIDHHHFEEVSSVDLCRIVGILLDNAMESAVKSSNHKIFISMTNHDHYFSLIVGNSYMDLPNIESIFELDFSTKGINRGTGLYSVRQIIKQYTKTQLKTSITPKWFIQELRFNF